MGDPADHGTAPPVIQLANDIARHLTYLSPADATEALAVHVETFWDPRMRRQLSEAATPGRFGIDPVVANYVARLDRCQ